MKTLLTLTLKDSLHHAPEALCIQFHNHRKKLISYDKEPCQITFEIPSFNIVPGSFLLKYSTQN